MTRLLANPAFGIIITILAFDIGLYVYRKTRLVFLHPMVISISIIIVILLIFDIPLDSYKKGGDLITFFLGPATVILAVPLYKQLEVLKKNAGSIIAGILIGSVSGVGSVILLGKLMKLDNYLILSLLSKSVTNPIGVELTRKLGGDSSVVVVAILITGILGAVIAPSVCRLLRIKNRIAVGLAIGTASHAVGTSKAIEIGEIEGAMSGLAIGLAGFTTVLIAPVLISLLM